MAPRSLSLAALASAPLTSATAIETMVCTTGTYIQHSPEWAAIRTWISANFG